MTLRPLLQYIPIALLCVAITGRAAEDAGKAPAPEGRIRDAGSREATPDIAAASDEAAQAIKLMKAPPGLEIKLWAAEPMLANPVAFNFDERGRIFVAETYRLRSSVLDIRDYRWLIEDELACRTVEDRAALIEKKFGPAGVRELSIEGEVLRLLEDSNHDGVADRTAVYADGFNGPLDGVAAGVLARRGQIWFANIPGLWRFTGENRAENRVEISHGYGVRFNFTGHDLHGLAFGPDGKLYYSIGDRGASVKTKEGGLVEVTDSGAVFRCNPDGTQLELFAVGLRNPQSLAFSENGDLFTGDNDSDQGDEERLVHVVEDGDSGWRIGYQFAPRGKGGPWNSERLWYPRHPEQPAYFIPPLCNIEDGPSGIAFYPGTGLNPSYRGSLFITHFKGAIATSGIYTYNLKASGASYEVADARPFLTSALPTDVKFGPDGRLYFSDWAEGWQKSKRGRIYAVSDPAQAGSALIRETEKLIASDWTGKLPDELAHLLAHADWRVRLEAQFTLAERGSASIPVFAAVAGMPSGTDTALARRHAVWGLGQLAAKDPGALAPLRPLLRDADSEVRAQAAKVLGDHGADGDAALLVAALGDESNRVKFFAAQGLGKLGRVEAVPALLAALRVNHDTDATLRHALVMGLVGCGARDRGALLAAIPGDSPAVRRGVLLALRRLDDPAIARFLTDPDPLIVREAALAINDAPVNAALPALADLLEKPLTDEPVILRAINARFRLGRPADADALANYAARDGAPAAMRAEALAQLALWPHPPQRDRLVGVFRPFADKTRDRGIVVQALEPLLPALLDRSTPAPVQTAALAAMQDLGITGAADTLFAMIADAGQPAGTRATALTALERIKDPRLTDAVALASASSSPDLRLAVLPIAARLSPADAVPVLTNLVTHGDIAGQKAAFHALGGMSLPLADKLLAAQLRALADGKVAPAVQLELITAARRRADPAIKTLLAQRDAAIAASRDPLAPYRVALDGGEAQRGARLFNNHPVLACIRCHRVGAEPGGDAGPNLAGIGAKHPREYLLESIVKPNATIAPGFDTIVLTLKSGAIAAGIVAGETDAAISLRTADNHLAEVRKTDIAKRESAPSGMPEVYGALLTSAQLRDVVAYLASLTGDSQGEAGDKPRALRGLPPEDRTE